MGFTPFRKINNIAELRLVRIFLLVSLFLLVSAKGWGQALSSVPTANPSVVCSGSDVQLDAVASGGSGSYSYAWTSDPTGFSSSIANPIVNPTVTTTYYVAVDDGITFVNSQVVVTVTTSLPVSVSITGDATTVCSGSTVLFTAVPTNGGTTPVYQWQVNGSSVGSNSSTYSYTPLNGDIVTCLLTSNETCSTGSPATSNALTITVTTSLPVSVSITGDATTVCSGSTVLFTAVPTNGGTTPVYQWQVNGSSVGSNSSTYSYTPLNGDIVTCLLTSNETCSTGSPATSNALTITVTTSLPVSVSITGDATTVCSGSTVLFTAVPTNGGTTPVYQWQVNGSSVGSNSSTYSYTPLNGDIVTCLLTSNETCSTGSPATSNALTITVTTSLPVSVSITGDATTVCSGSTVLFTAVPTNGGTTPVYQWQVNGSSVGSNSSTYSYTPLNGDIVTCLLTSNETCSTGSPATSNALTITVTTSLPVSVSITGDATTVCSGSTVLFTAVPTNGGTTPVYQWQVNGSSVGSNSSTYSYTPLNGDIVTCLLTSNETCSTGSPATSNALTITVTTSLPVSVSITGDATTVCSGSTVLFTAVPTNGGTTPVYQWQVNGSSVGSNSSTYSYTPLNGDIVTCLLTSNETCSTGSPATSNALTITVTTSLPVSVSITGDATTVCSGSTVLFTAVPTNGGTTPVYQWQVNGSSVGSNSSTYSYTPLNGDIVTCLLTSNETCSTGSPATSNALTITVTTSLPVSVSITGDATTVCSGSTVLFTAVPTNGGTTPVYQWQVNGSSVGSNSSTYSYTPLNGDIVTCLLTSNETCSTGSPATSNALTITVTTSLPVSVSITGDATTVCSGSTVLFTAVPTNGGTTPVYQWQVNGSSVGSNSSTYSYTPLNGDIVTCLLTSNETCSTGSPATSNALTITVTTSLPVSVSITGDATTVCSGSTVLFTAVPTNGGTTPVYQWQVNGSSVGSNSSTYSYTPLNGDIVTCLLTSNETCSTGSPATSNALTITVTTSLPVSVSITGDATTVCSGSTVLFTAVPTNGGTTPVYQWQVNGSSVGSNSSTYSYTPLNGDIVTCLLTSNETCSTGSPATSNALTITVTTSLPVSVSITGDATTVCSGSTVLFTAVPTNGGTTPVYQWQVNGSSVGSNSSTYSYTPLNGDIVTCLLTSNETCSTGSPATSNALTITVTTSLPVSVSITGDATTVCSGSTVLFTAVPTNGGTTPVYQWQVNGSSVGSNSSTYSYTPLNGDIVTCLLTSNETCSTGSPATSNALTITVTTSLPVSVSITGDATTVCSGSTVLFTAVPTNGGTTPVYQWQVNGSSVGSNSSTYSYTPLNGDIVTCLLTSNETCSTGSPATSNALTITVTTSLPVSVSITGDATTVCSGSTVLFTAVPTNGGTTPVYQWQVNGSSVGSNSSTYSYTPLNGDIVTCLLTSNETCSTGSPATSNALTITVTTSLPVSVSITGDATTVCSGSTVLFTAVPTNGGTTPVYQWQVNGSSVGSNSSTYSYTPLNGDIVTCLLTSNETCSTGSPATSNALTITVTTSLPVSVSITGDATTVCSGSTVLFTAVPTNGGTTPVYQWQVNGSSVGSNSSTYSYTPLNGDIVTCLLTSNETCSTGSPATSNALTITVTTSLPVSVSITGDATTVCSGSTVLFTAVPTNGGTTPVYQWQVNGSSVGSNSSTYSYTPLNGDIVTCLLTSNETCSTGSPATSNALTITVTTSLPVSVSITGDATTVCSGSTVLFTAVPTNGGTTPVYQWQVNGSSVGSNSSTYSYTPLNGDIVTCLLTSNETCSTGSPATSNALTITVTTSLPVSVSITGDATTVCSGSTVLFTAVPTNGGTTPVYQWQVNGSSVGSNSSTYSYTPLNGDIVTCLLTSNETCSTGSPATSNALTITVTTSLPVSVSITGDATTVCSGSTVLFTAVPTNGGTTPVYQWQVNGSSVGSNSSTYSYTPLNGDIVTCLLTSNETCSTGSPATSNALTITVTTSLPVSVSITGDATTVCSGSTVLFTAVPTNGGTTPVYQWQVNGSSVGSNSSTYSYTPLNGDIVTCLLTSNETCSTGSPATSNALTITVTTSLPVSVSITGDATTVCSGSTVLFTAVPTNGGTTPVYQWQVNGSSVGSNSSTYSYTPLNGDIVTCLLTSNETCSTGSPVTSSPLVISVNTLPTTSAISGSATPACNGTGINYSVTLTPGSSYLWTVPPGAIITTGSAGPDNNQITVTFGSTNGNITVTETNSASCVGSTQSLGITLAGCGLNAAFSATPTTTCLGSPVIFTDASTGTTVNTTYSWNFGSGATPATANTIGPYTVTYNTSGLKTISLTITEGASSTITRTDYITVSPLPTAPTGTATQSFCSGTSPTVGNLTATGLVIQWYSASNGGSLLAPSTALVNGTHYYASQTVSGCESILRFDVIATVTATPAAPTGTATQSFCSGTSPTVGNLTATGLVIQWYSASSGGSLLAPSTALVNGTHYYASQTVSGCESILRFDVIATVTATPAAPTGTATQSFCSGTSPTVGNLTAIGLAIQWYSASSGGSLLAPSTALVNGTHYYASQTVSGCESILRFDVTATVTTIPTSANAGSDQTGVLMCGLTTATLAGNTPLVGTGAWTITSGIGGTVTTPTSPTSTFTGVAGTEYTLRWTISNAPCTASTDDVNISFNQNPTLIITNPTAVCSPNTINLTLPAVTAGSTAGLTYTYWTDEGATIAYGTPTTATAGTYYIKGTTAAGCFDISPVTVTVNPLPTVAPITGGATNVNVGASTPPFINATVGGTWSIIPGSGTASIAADGVVTGLTPGTVTVTYTYTNSCGSAVATATLTINVVFSTSFIPGWNWFSVNTQMSDMSLTSVLPSVNTDGDYIKSQTSSATYYSGYGWFGSLSVIDPTKLYMIKVQNNISISYSGNPVDCSSTSIGLVTGWNWVGYLPQSALTIDDALSSLSLLNLDYIKNQTKSSTYYTGYGWFGPLGNLSPSEGYLIKLGAPGTLKYPDGHAKRSEEIFTNANDISFPSSGYEYNGSVTASVYVDGALAGSENDRIYAYVDDEIRGEAVGSYFDPAGCYLFPVMIYSNLSMGELVSFKYYDYKNDKFYSCNNTITFTKDMIVADAFKPLALNVNKNMPADVKREESDELRLKTYPNPFDHFLNIEYIVSKQTNVRLIIYDSYGKIIKILIDEEQKPDNYSIKWEPYIQSGGIYIIRLQIGDRQIVRKVILTRKNT